MMKRLPSRNPGCKGLKVKHVLQIFVLLGVCFWLIYQVKHNHDKKKEFDKDVKLSVSTQTDQILKLGRRDLLPGKHEEIQNKTREEEDEDGHNIEEDEENKHDHEEQEDGDKPETEDREDNKQAAEEQEEDENKNEDMRDEGRGGGDDENDKEKSELDATDRDDEFLFEEKKKEKVDEKYDENEDDEKEGLDENHNNHKAQEEHYKGDDASSAVAHDTHATSSETEAFNLENSDVNLEMNISQPENETTYSDESVRKQNDSNMNVSVSDQDGMSYNATAVKGTGYNTLFNLVDDSSYLNKTAPTNSDSHLESISNLTVVTTAASNNMTEDGNHISTWSEQEQNRTVVLSESDQAQNSTTIPGDVKNVQTEGLEQNGNRISDEYLHETNSTVSLKTENGGFSEGESSNLVALNVTESTYGNERSESDISESNKSKGKPKASETDDNHDVDATEDEMLKGDTETVDTDETSDSSSTNEALDSAENDVIDSSDSHIHEDLTEAGTDLGTLPDVRSEGDDSDETAEE